MNVKLLLGLGLLFLAAAIIDYISVWRKRRRENLHSTMSPDPLKYCDTYKQRGCAHVDGPGCDVRTCTINKKEVPIEKM